MENFCSHMMYGGSMYSGEYKWVRSNMAESISLRHGGDQTDAAGSHATYGPQLLPEKKIEKQVCSGRKNIDKIWNKLFVGPPIPLASG